MVDKAIILVDMLNDFVTGKLECERAERIIPNLQELVEAARMKNVPVVYSNDAHYENDFEIKKRWEDHALKGTPGAEVIPELEPGERDFLVDKRTYDGFFETGLDQLLRSMGVNTIVLCGLHTNMCVRHTAAGAFFRGYDIIIAEDGVEAFTEEDHLEGLEYLKYVYNAEVVEIQEIIKNL
jgi:nicotinamidase-related amidase